MTSSLLTVGVDWISATAKYEDRKTWQALNLLGDKLQDTTLRNGENGLYTQLYGYSGLKCGAIFVGHRADSSIIQISGKASREKWPIIVETGARITRLDLEATVLISPRDDSVAVAAGEQAIKSRAKENAQRKVRFINGYGSGDTLYIGSMQSEHYCRLYDKGKESGIAEYDACWRYEVTYRRNKASFLAGALSQSASPEGTMLSTIYNYFYTKGVTPLFSPSSAAPLKTPPERPAGYDKKLEWMKTIIGPLCNKLIGAGYGKELYKVLPISEIQRYADNHK